MGCGSGVLTTGPDWSVLHISSVALIFVFWFSMLAKDHIHCVWVDVLS